MSRDVQPAPVPSIRINKFFTDVKPEESKANLFLNDLLARNSGETPETETYKVSDSFLEFLTLVVTEVIPFVLRLD